MSEFTIFIVEDDTASLRLLQGLFSREEHVIEALGSAEACLEALATRVPDLFLLDVGLPGIDGYELCRRLREETATAEVPVIFISAHVDIESRLRGYEAGGHDFVVKPFDIREVRQKVEVLRLAAENRSMIRSQLADSDLLTSLVMSNLDEYAVLVRFLRELNPCAEFAEVADLVLALLRNFGLAGVVQLRLPGRELTLGAAGASSPLELSVLNHVRTLERIFEFRRHGVYNFDRVTVMVNNMPIEDAERCGRLRDHLAIAFETVDAKLEALIAAQANALASEQATLAATAIELASAGIDERLAHARVAGAAALRELMDEMLVAFAHLGLSAAQEESIQDIVQQKTQLLASLYDLGDDTRQAMDALGRRLDAVCALLAKAERRT